MSENDSEDIIRPTDFKSLNVKQAPTYKQKISARWLLWLGFFIFLVCLSFLLTARSIQIQTDTISEPKIEISGLAIPIGNRFLIREGNYPLQVSATGYEPLQTVLNVGSESNQLVQLSLSMLPGIVTIQSKPAGALISLDGISKGVTPKIELVLEAGEYELVLSHNKYLDLKEKIEIKGRAIEQELNFTMQPGWADITVASSPQGAEVRLDSQILGITPATVPVPEGSHQLVLKLPGYAPLQIELETTAGDPKNLGTIDLTPASGVIELNSSPAAANVSLDGKFLGQAPLEIEISPNDIHGISVSLPGYKRELKEIKLGPGERKALGVTLQPRYGELHFNIQPKTAELIINGKSRGPGNNTLSLPATPQKIEVRQQGYASNTQIVTPVPDFPLSIDVKLLTTAEARVAHLRPIETTSANQKLILFNPSSKPNKQFKLGAPRSDPGRRADEVLRTVKLERLFYLQNKEVTNAQFRLFEPNHNSGQIQGASLNREQQPVVQINWQQAAQYCNWLSRQEQLPQFYIESEGLITGHNPRSTGYRLPTEAEWAWAARVRGDKIMRFSWGNTFPPPSGKRNFADDASAYINGRVINGYADSFVVSAPVGSFPANHRNLYDLDSNVAEWIHDVYQIAGLVGDPLTDPLGIQDGDNRVIRGASWAHSKISDLRLSARDYGQMGRDDVGFRIARYAE